MTAPPPDDPGDPDDPSAAGALAVAATVDLRGSEPRPRPDDASPTSIERDLGSMAAVLRELAAIPAAALAPGERVGAHYQIERALGAGGMGVVHLARDLRLDRAVAIKLGRVISPRELARLEREAVTLAQLSHPNVVVIYEVGRHADRLYLAMEYVDGGTLREWLAARERSPRELAAVFASIADGLAAAHARGLIHCDIKPDNLLIGSDGRPRIADFGIARAAAAGDDGSDGVAGTPPYMAPEHAGGAAFDARADQFSFAVTLWEALHGVRPLPDEPAARAIACARGELRTARPVPRHLDRALRRALRADPADRWPGMAELGRALRHDPAGRRRLIAVIGVAVVAIAATVAWAATRSPGGAASCAGGAAEVARSWNPTRAGAIERAFTARGASGARWAATATAGLDRWAEQWAAAYRTACRATRVERSQSETALDQRMACLGRSRRQAEVVVDQLVTGDPALATNLHELIETITDPTSCDAAEAGTGDPYPTDAARRGQIEQWETRFATATVRRYAAPMAETRATFEALVAAATELGWRPAIARAELELGHVCRSLEDLACASSHLHRAFDVATAAGHDRLATYAAASLGGMLVDTGRLDEAATWLAVASSVQQRVPDDPWLTIFVLRGQARLAEERGQTAPSDALFAQADELALAANPDDSDLGAIEYNRALRGVRRSHSGDAVAGLERAVAFFDRAGNGPMSVDARENLSLALFESGSPQRACEVAAEAVQRAEAWFGPDQVAVASPLEKHARCLQLTGESARAIELYERATALIRHARGDDAAETTMALARLGSAYCGVERYRDCVDATLRATASFEREHRPPDLIAESLGIAAYGARALGELDQARDLLERALALVGDADSGNRANLLVELAHVAIAQGRRRAAVPVLERAAAICDRIEVAPHIGADVRLTLARELARGGARTPRVKALATAARTALVALDPDGNAAQIAEADALIGR